MLEEEVDYFRDFLDLIQKTKKNNNESFKQREIEIKAANLPSIVEDNASDFYDPYDGLIDDAYRSSELEQLMLKTLIIGIFIFLEHSINFVCWKLEKEHKVLFSANDLKGNGITRSIKYINKVLDINFPIDEKIRKEFEIARIIRNSLVHTNAVVDKKDLSKIHTFISTNPDLIRISELRKITLTENYANCLIKLSSKFCRDLGEIVSQSNSNNVS